MPAPIRVVLELALLLPAIAVLIPCAFLAIEAILARPKTPHDVPLASIGPDDDDPPPARPSAAILIPAHNEEAGIAATVRRLRPFLAPADRILVVADNCTDATASAARAAGALVLERTHDTLRGKGYALAAGLARMQSWPQHPDAVVVLDADCAFDPSRPRALEALVRTAVAEGRPAQAVNLVDAEPDAPPRARIALFAFRMKNLVRPLGLGRLGGGCLLTGTGMALPWGLVQPDDLASGDLVEDMRLGVDLAVAGRTPVLCTEALVRSPLAGSDAGWRSQRTRWEQGHLRSIAAHAPRLLTHALRRPRLALLALELSVPPLSLLLLSAAAAWLLVAGVALATLIAPPAVVGLPALVLATAALLLLGVAVLTAWRRFGRTVLPAADLPRVGAYAVSKLGIYRGLLRGGERTWVRTERTPTPASEAA